MDTQKFDILIIGAGASGLMAAWEFAQAGKKTAVIEARNRIGGRIHTITDNRFDMPVELGAEFIHGKLEQTLSLLKKSGTAYNKVKGDLYKNENGKLEKQEDFIEDYKDLNKKFRELKQDLSIADFLNNYLQEDKFEELRFTLRNYIEGYYSADINKASTFALMDELNNSDDEQYRPEGGYGHLMQYFESKLKEKAVPFFLSSPVTKIIWREGNTEVITDKGSYLSTKILITVPMGVLQQEKIVFSPGLPGKVEAATKLGYGPVVKTILQFETPFWKELEHKEFKELSFIFSKESIPTWWTQYPIKSAIITGWSGGPHALELKGLTKEEILNKAIDSLSHLFSIDVIQLHQQLKGWHIEDWLNDPYSLGAYSYDVVDGIKYKNILKTPAEDTIYFAGEGLIDGPEIGTVEAALVSGRDTARSIIASFKN